MQRGMHRAQYQSYLDQDRGERRMETADKDVSKLLTHAAPRSDHAQDSDELTPTNTTYATPILCGRIRKTCSESSSMSKDVSREGQNPEAMK
ncbi:hypothetical protein COOONC_03758 [Cooperia oncophora]